jgi:hypothetical protein
MVEACACHQPSELQSNISCSSACNLDTTSEEFFMVLSKRSILVSFKAYTVLTPQIVRYRLTYFHATDQLLFSVFYIE